MQMLSGLARVSNLAAMLRPAVAINVRALENDVAQIDADAQAKTPVIGYSLPSLQAVSDA